MTAADAATPDEVRKLRKINKVLMDRVERDMDAHGGNAYSLFQTAITLESRVSERTAELTCLTQRLVHEMSERQEAEKALLLAKAEAEQANLGKTRFLAAASHDLQQPLNAARLFLGALGDEVADGRPHELVQRLGASLESLSELLATLLDISKLDAGVWPVRLVSFPAAPLLARLVEEYGPQAEACGIALRVVQSSAVLHTDRQLFERILRNLISNAIRYTETGRILIGCRRNAGRLRVEVWDSGIGIPSDKLAHVFEEFGQLGNNPRRDNKGVGLGLAIVDRIARLLNVPIHVVSRVGHGSCFGVSAPLGTPPSAGALAPAPMGGLAGLAGRLVAVVDSDGRELCVIKDLLGAWMCHPVAAATVDELLAAFENEGGAPDLIIADDLRGAGPFGGETIAALRAHFGPIPALLISDDRSSVRKACAHAQDYALLAKPVSPAKLRSMLSYLLSAPAEGIGLIPP